MVHGTYHHHGNKNILVMIDQLTSWPIAVAIPDKEATTIAEAVSKSLILQHGCPEIILSDNGKEFSNDTLAYVCDQFNIKQHFTSPYTPRSNGKTENFNKFLKPQFANSVRKTMLHGIKCLTRSYSHTNVVLTLQLVKHHIPCSISETHPYQFTN